MEAQLLDTQTVQHWAHPGPLPPWPRPYDTSFLDNRFLQLGPSVPGSRVDAEEREPRARPRIEDLKRRHFGPEGREERTRKSLAAIGQPNPICLTREQWIWIAEALDSEDEFE
jgi:hypothetical protein